MNYTFVFNKIEKLLRSKNVTEQEYKSAMYMLRPFEKSRPDFYYSRMVKILLKMGKFKESRVYLLKLKKIDPQNELVYYSLYKIESYEEKFSEALSSLMTYQNLLENRNVHFDFSLPITLINLYQDMCTNYLEYQKKNYRLNDFNYFGITLIQDDTLQQYFVEIDQTLQAKQFKKMNQILVNMDQYIKDHNIPMEVKTIRNIVESIIKKEKNCQHEQILSQDIEIIQNKLGIQVKTKPTFIDFCNYVKKIIYQNIEEAELLYSHIPLLYSTNLYDLELNCLKNMIEEQKQYLNLSKVQRNRFGVMKKTGNKYYHQREFIPAYEYYLAGLYITNHNIFNYYLGKTLYKNGNRKDAKEYLEQYIKTGGNKLVKAFLYLNQIEHGKYSREIARLSIFLNGTYEIYTNEDRNKRIEMQKNRRESPKLFSENNQDSEVYKELQKIKDMLGYNKKVAEKMLNELERNQFQMTADEKEMIRQFQKNKKLYRMKR